MSAVRILGLAMVVAVVAAAASSEVGLRDPWIMVALAVFAVAATALLLVVRGMPRAAGVAALAVAGVSAVAVYLLDPSQVPLGLFLVGALAALVRPERAGFAIAALSLAAYAAAEVTAGRASWTLAATASGVLFFALIGRLVLREREQRERIAALLADLESSRTAEREASAQAERARLARDVHDVLAHTLSGLAIHLEAARLLVGADGTAPALRETVERAHQLSRTGLEEARRAVGALRGDELPGPRSLPRLVEEHRLAAGAPASYLERGEPFPLSTEAELAIYRTAQEALSNVRKHAARAPVEVELTWERDTVALTVVDAGGGVPIDAPSSGFGLAGMRERAELAGAVLEAGPSGAGFRVRLVIPRG